MRIAFLRHGPTAWNDEGRLQGMTDVPLSSRGRAHVATWRVPYQDWRWACSPLTRARETAVLLGAPPSLAVEPALREMAYGEWEGRTLDELRAREPQGMRDAETRGLDMAPPGGESPRQVMDRLRPWFAAQRDDVVAVSHKGVIRVVLAMATGWDMKSRQPVKLDWNCLHVFAVAGDGAVAVDRLNTPLGSERAA
ncbi:MAG: histidine phosphatase family protein [Alphaproteobacteria bacterium]|nr:histidine phosphatase family protein [Alphaproteobacteria bacterium]MCW5741113.1 histidine phosphatase family protein [Alphaproteobacteria bacterium]